jgi:hypothetical protein
VRSLVELSSLNKNLLQNMIEKPEDRQTVKENCISMVQCKTMKQLELIEQKKFDDEDIQVTALRYVSALILCMLAGLCLMLG